MKKKAEVSPLPSPASEHAAIYLLIFGRALARAEAHLSERIHANGDRPCPRLSFLIRRVKTAPFTLKILK